MARHGYYDEQYGFVPYDDCPQDNLYSESEAKHTFSPPEPKTNADRIRSMTDEELAELIGDNIDCAICKKEIFQITTCPGSLTADGKDCYSCWLDWLKQESEDE